MEADPVTCLMGVAAAHGLLKPFVPWDYQKLFGERLLLRVLKGLTTKEICRMQYDRQIAALQYLEKDSEGTIFKHHFDASQDLLMDYLRLCQPWVNWDEALKQAEADDYHRDLNTWEHAFGSLDDPAVQEDIARLAKKLVSPGPLDE